MNFIIPLPFFAMWGIMFLGILTHVLVKIDKINRVTPDEIPWEKVVKKFLKKEWASYGVSLIFTAILAYSFVFMKRFQDLNNEQISYWAKWIPLSVIGLYFVGVLNQWIFYFLLGRIQSKGNVDIDLLKDKNESK